MGSFFIHFHLYTHTVAEASRSCTWTATARAKVTGHNFTQTQLIGTATVFSSSQIHTDRTPHTIIHSHSRGGASLPSQGRSTSSRVSDCDQYNRRGTSPRSCILQVNIIGSDVKYRLEDILYLQYIYFTSHSSQLGFPSTFFSSLPLCLLSLFFFFFWLHGVNLHINV